MQSEEQYYFGFCIYDQLARPQMRPTKTSIKKTFDWLDVG